MSAKQILTETLKKLGWEADSGCTITEVPREVRRSSAPVFEVELRDSRGCWRKRFTEETCTVDNIGFKVGLLEGLLRVRGPVDAMAKITIDNALGKEGWHQYFDDEQTTR